MNSFILKFKEIEKIALKFFHDLLKKKYYLITFIAITLLALIVRYKLLPYRSHDYSTYIMEWYRTYYQNGGLAGLGISNGDYPPLYMMYIALLANFGFEPESEQLLYFIKGFSIFFDFVGAFYAMKLCYFITNNKPKSLACYFLYLFIPSVILNSSCWGQADSIYTAFIIISVYYLVRGKTLFGIIFYGISFSFKIQSIFYFPVILFLLMRNKVGIYHILLIPFIYVITCIPSIIAGRSAYECLIGIYFSLVQSDNPISNLIAINAGSIYNLLVPGSSMEPWANQIVAAGTFFAVAVVGIVLVYFYKSKVKLTKDNMIKIAYLLVFICPFVLPKMHDRYFFASDCLGMVYLFTNSKNKISPILGFAASSVAYSLYLFGTAVFMNPDLSNRYAALLNLIAIILVVRDLLINSDEGEECLPKYLEV